MFLFSMLSALFESKPCKQKVCQYVTGQQEAKRRVKTMQLPFKYIQTKLQEHHNDCIQSMDHLKGKDGVCSYGYIWCGCF